MIEAITAWDFSVLNGVQYYMQSDFLDVLMPIITLFGEAGIFWILVAFTMIHVKKTYYSGIGMGIALFIGLIVVNVFMKNIFHRIRPYDIQQFTLLIPKMHDYSFPSGHSLACFEAATVVVYTDKKVGIFALLLTVAVSFSRIYLYVHYPTDVIAGAILGVIFGIIGIKLSKPVGDFVKKNIYKIKDSIINKLTSGKNAE